MEDIIEMMELLKKMYQSLEAEELKHNISMKVSTELYIKGLEARLIKKLQEK